MRAMAVHRLELRPERHPGVVLGDATYDDSTGQLAMDEVVARTLRADRRAFEASSSGGDRAYGQMLVERGWSNGYVTLTEALP